MKNKKLAAIPLLIAITLSAFGFVYAHWSDYVKIDGTVEMGKLTLAFDYVEPPDARELYWDPTHTYKINGEYLGKDVGDCDAWYEDEVYCEHSDKYGYKTLIINITNAYPQYIVHTEFKLHNIGTIPINICKYSVTGEKINATGVLIYDLLWDGNNPGGLWEDVNDNGVVDAGDIEVIWIEITNSLPYQIDPCNTEKAQIDLEFYQEAQECHTYKIYVELVGVQWNKPCP